MIKLSSSKILRIKLCVGPMGVDCGVKLIGAFSTFCSPTPGCSLFSSYTNLNFNRETMKGSVKTRYDLDKMAAAATVSVNAGDIKLRASLTDATVVKGPSLNGLALSLEKPGSFIVDYNVPKQDFRFQFMSTVRVAGKPLNLNYMHFKGDRRTTVDGTLVLDPANKVSANHMIGSGNCKLKYTYVHKGVSTFEPSYDFAKNAWDFSVSQRVYGDDVLKAMYQTSSKNLALEWSRNSKLNGCFKISASLNLAEDHKMPKLIAESTWDFEM